MKLFLLSTSAMLIATGVHAATYQCNLPTDENQTTCPLPRIPFTCEDGELACCKVTMTPEERQRVRNRTTRDSTLRQLGTVNLNNQTCTAAAEGILDDSSSSPDEDEFSSEDEEVDTPPEEEYEAELDEEFEFAMTENRRRCRFNSDCGNRQFCDRSLGPRGQGRCVNDSNRNRCNRDSQCRSGQVCNRQGGVLTPPPIAFAEMIVNAETEMIIATKTGTAVSVQQVKAAHKVSIVAMDKAVSGCVVRDVASLAPFLRWQ